MSVACVLIVSEKRIPLVKAKVLPSVLGVFDEVIWVGDGEPGDGYRFLHVPPVTGTTMDALLKRDVGTLATNAGWIFYLCDDHAADPMLRDWLRILPSDKFDICVPGRFTTVNGEQIPLNMGLADTDPNRPYCAGHAGLFRRSLIQQRPWTSMPHDRLWDLLSSRIYMDMGARMVGTPFQYLVEDLEPEREPWK